MRTSDCNASNAQEKLDFDGVVDGVDGNGRFHENPSVEMAVIGGSNEWLMALRSVFYKKVSKWGEEPN